MYRYTYGDHISNSANQNSEIRLANQWWVELDMNGDTLDMKGNELSYY